MYLFATIARTVVQYTKWPCAKYMRMLPFVNVKPFKQNNGGGREDISLDWMTARMCSIERDDQRPVKRQKQWENIPVTAADMAHSSWGWKKWNLLTVVEKTGLATLVDCLCIWALAPYENQALWLTVLMLTICCHESRDGLMCNCQGPKQTVSVS